MAKRRQFASFLPVCLVVFGLLLCLAVPLRGQSGLPSQTQPAVRAAMHGPLPLGVVLPAIPAETLSGRPIVLPAPRRLTLLVPAAWWPQANALCARHAVLDCYQPARAGQFRALRTAHLKRSVDDHLWDRFAVINRSTAGWKALLSNNSRAIAALLAPDGTVLWQAVGKNSDPMPGSLEVALEASNF